jgi:hypothetical protein
MPRLARLIKSTAHCVKRGRQHLEPPGVCVQVTTTGIGLPAPGGSMFIRGVFPNRLCGENIRSVGANHFPCNQRIRRCADHHHVSLLVDDFFQGCYGSAPNHQSPKLLIFISCIPNLGALASFD